MGCPPTRFSGMGRPLLPAILRAADKFVVERTAFSEQREGEIKSKGRDSRRKPRPFPSFDRVARQQSPTADKFTREAIGVKSAAFP